MTEAECADQGGGDAANVVSRHQLFDGRRRPGIDEQRGVLLEGCCESLESGGAGAAQVSDGLAPIHRRGKEFRGRRYRVPMLHLDEAPGHGVGQLLFEAVGGHVLGAQVGKAARNSTHFTGLA